MSGPHAALLPDRMGQARMGSVVVKAAEELEERLRAYVASVERRIRRRAQQVLDAISQGFPEREISRRISDLGGLIDDLERVAAREVRALADEINQAYLDAGRAAAVETSSALGVTVVFDQANERAIAAMRANTLRLVREFTKTQVAVTRRALLSGIQEGLNPLTMARSFRGSIGLTEFQQQAVERYRQLLMADPSSAEGRALLRQAQGRALHDGRWSRSIQRAVREGRGLPQDQIDRMVSRYSERYVQYRSRVIARTEALRSVHEGSHELYTQAVENGSLQADSLTREWRSAQDDKVRDSHQEMDGQVVGLTEPFVSPKGAALMFPGDPNAPPEETIQCRCVVLTRMK